MVGEHTNGVRRGPVQRSENREKQPRALNCLEGLPRLPRRLQHNRLFQLREVSMPQYSFRVNGEAQSVEAPEDMPLMWVLRDLLGLTGTKFACGENQCGACTVHVDGSPVRSCSRRISGVEGRDVTTIEGLAQDGLHALQSAWIAEGVPQCGYCQSGQIMSAAALLADNPDPTDEEIDRALLRNICRCGTYQRIRKAIHRAAQEG